ncbi:MAG: hypothetical protein IJI43_01930 [Bacilli bacterium]|nr:hypothetical protein [Bacilli bacterium]
MMMSENNNQNPIVNPEKQKENKTIFTIIVVVLVIAVISVTGYIVYDTIQNRIAAYKEAEKKKKEKAKQQEIESLELISADGEYVTSMFNILTNGLNNKCGYVDYFNKDSFTVNDLSNEKVFDMMLKSYEQDKIKEGVNFAPGVAFTEEELNQKIKKYFGSTYNYVHKSYKSCPSFNYDPTKKLYTIPQVTSCVRTCKYPHIKKVTKAEKSDKVMYFYVRVLFSDNTGKYYKDSEMTNQITNLTADESGRYDTINSNYSRGKLYKMKFVNDNNNFVFQSSKLVEENY